MAEDEHEEAVVLLAAEAHQLARDEDRDQLAVQGAVEGLVLADLQAERLGGVPGGAEALGAGLAAELVGAVLRHVDHAGGDRDAAGVGERGDEIALAFGRPAVVAGLLAGDGGEIGEGGLGHALVGD
ncbi:MAG TPA: hypothetical protein VLK25_05260 [Allosphingosinicella sp.]|nr:hypothetical protein [Allosphingosinicella sp.]